MYALLLQADTVKCGKCKEAIQGKVSVFFHHPRIDRNIYSKTIPTVLKL